MESISNLTRTNLHDIQRALGYKFKPNSLIHRILSTPVGSNMEEIIEREDIGEELQVAESIGDYVINLILAERIFNKTEFTTKECYILHHKVKSNEFLSQTSPFYRFGIYIGEVLLKETSKNRQFGSFVECLIGMVYTDALDNNQENTDFALSSARNAFEALLNRLSQSQIKKPEQKQLALLLVEPNQPTDPSISLFQRDFPSTTPQEPSTPQTPES